MDGAGGRCKSVAMERLSPEQAEEILASHAPRQGVERIGLDQALGRVAAQGMRALNPLPAFETSAVDGFAVVGESRQSCALIGRLYAGDGPAPTLGPGQALFVATGAVVPADAGVAWQEEVTVEGQMVVLRHWPRPGDNVRHVGEEVRKGASILGRGERLGPGQMALLRATGVSEVSVRRPVTVAVLSVGSELVEEGAFGPGMVRNTNGPWMAQQLVALGCEVISLTLGDDEARFEAEVRRLDSLCDLLLTTGGASKGPRDFVRRVSARLGRRTLVDGLLMRPGQPLQAFSGGHALWIALPGNPLATALGFDRLVRPLLAAMEGRGCEARSAQAYLKAALPPNRGKVPRFWPAELGLDDGRLEVRPASYGGSGAVSALRQLDAWVRSEPGQGRIRAGSVVPVWIAHWGGR